MKQTLTDLRCTKGYRRRGRLEKATGGESKKKWEKEREGEQKESERNRDSW